MSQDSLTREWDQRDEFFAYWHEKDYPHCLGLARIVNLDSLLGESMKEFLNELVYWYAGTKAYALQDDLQSVLARYDNPKWDTVANNYQFMLETLEDDRYKDYSGRFTKQKLEFLRETLPTYFEGREISYKSDTFAAETLGYIRKRQEEIDKAMQWEKDARLDENYEDAAKYRDFVFEHTKFQPRNPDQSDE